MNGNAILNAPVNAGKAGVPDATPIQYSVFRSVNDLKSFDAHVAAWPELVALIQQPKTYRSKKACPLIKLATFGDRANDKGNLRHDDNVDQVYGIEGDYDGNELPAAEAATRLRAAGVRAVVYTSATSGVVDAKRNPKGGPRWRVLVPLSGPVAPELREELVSVLNGALGGVLGGESWVLSQTFYFGKVEGVEYEVHVVDGELIDLHAALGEIEPIGPPVALPKSVKLTKPRRKSDANEEEVAFLVNSPWFVGYRDDGGLDVRCVRHEMHGTDSGPSSTTYYPSGVGSRAAGFSCRHQSCGKPTTTEFIAATGLDKLMQRRMVAEFAVVRPTPGEPEPLPALERDKMGRAEPTRSNLVAALSHGGGGRVAFDGFTGDLMLSEGSRWRKFVKTDYAALAVRLEGGQARFKHVQKETLRDIVELVAAQNIFDSAQRWIDALRWDGVSRVDQFCARYFGAESSAYASAVSRYLWSGFAARVIEPGAKCDMLVTLVGTQGAVKTTAIEALAPLPETFGEIDLTKMDDNLTRKLRGKLVCEIAELKGLRSRDADSIKAWLSRRFEEHVEKWDTFTTRTPRRCMFIGTTNDAEFLDDETGERRHLPLRVAGGDVAAIERDRDQLWAEGAVLFRREGVCWKDALDLARAEHAEFKVVDAWHDDVETYLAERAAGALTTGEILERCIGLVKAHQTKAVEMRVSRVLSALGYAKRNTRVGGRMTRHWSKS